MIIKVRAMKVPKSTPYLTAGKIYDCKLIDNGDQLGRITVDDGKTHSIYISHCAHLEGDAWEIVEEA